jgi:hypothetical protein
MIMSRVAGYTVPGHFHQIFWARHSARFAHGAFPGTAKGRAWRRKACENCPPSRLSATPV